MPGNRCHSYLRAPTMNDRPSGRSRNAVGVYERPHPLRTRKVLVPVVIFVLMALVYGLYFLLR
jgi:hypothetical protein